MQILLYLYDDKVLILKYFLFLSNTIKYQNLIQSAKKGVWVFM